jgi:glyoxylase-like metal-dependent hydrolase (beta-lactamase superfamily II)
LRAVSISEDALVVTSAFWQTNAVALRSGEEAMLIDSPYLPDELDALPGVLAGAGFEPDGLVATHADFDHLLGRVAYPDKTLGMAESSVQRIHASPGEAQRALRQYDDEFYVVRGRPLALGHVQGLPVPGSVEIGDRELELHPADGHTVDGMAIFDRAQGLLIVGDYLSDVEIPWIHGTVADYRATLARLAPLVEAATTVVPGHGSPNDRDTTLRILEEDADYLDGLEAGEARIPKPRDTKAQRGIHTENVEHLGA